LVFTNNFNAEDDPYASQWHQPFISLSLFHNGTDLWAVGPTNPSDFTAPTNGYELPLALTGIDWHTQRVPGLEGFLLYNVIVDDRNPYDIVSYLVGWMPAILGTNETVHNVAFGIVRVHVNIMLPYLNRFFWFNYTTDVLPLTYGGYVAYNSVFKPHLHYDNDTNILIVVDPATSALWTVQAGPGNSPLSKLQFTSIRNSGVYITSTFFHPDTNILYVGYASEGIGNGTVQGYEMGRLTQQYSITFDQILGNPRALALDEPSDTVYVGFNGGDIVIQLNYLLTVTGYQRVPFYATKIEGVRVGTEHVYFITNEQHSKVMRVAKSDFCSKVCPYMGYCEKGKCKCSPNYALSSDGKACNLATSSKEEKGAAIALGILFAITFILATLGWILYWRVRKGGYQTV